MTEEREFKIGACTFFVEMATEKTSKNNNLYVNVKLRAIDETGKGQDVWHILMDPDDYTPSGEMTNQQIQKKESTQVFFRRNMKLFCDSIGINFKNKEDILRGSVDKKGRCITFFDMWNGEKRIKVSKFLPYDEKLMIVSNEPIIEEELNDEIPF